MKILIRELKNLGYSFVIADFKNENIKKYVKHECKVSKVFIIETNCNKEKIIDKYLTNCVIRNKDDLKFLGLKNNELMNDYAIINERGIDK